MALKKGQIRQEEEELSEAHLGSLQGSLGGRARYISRGDPQHVAYQTFKRLRKHGGAKKRSENSMGR